MIRSWSSIGFATLAVIVGAGPAAGQTIAITGGTVLPVSGPRIEAGTVLIRDGRIEAVGASVAIPADATRIDATGKWVTPGLIHAATTAGLGVRGLQGFGERTLAGEVTAAFNVRDAIDPHALDLSVARTGGITTGVLGPSGPFVNGHAVVANLAGETVEAMVVRSPAALVINLTATAREAGGGSRAGATARLRLLFQDARTLAARRGDWSRAQMQPLSAPAVQLEALLPALDGEMLVVFQADRDLDILNALALAKEFSLRVMIHGGAEAWKVAPRLAEAGVPVSLTPNTSIPSFDGLGARLDNATLLRQAGVEVIIAQNDSGGERNLRYGAGNAVRNGMGWDEAMQAVTLVPARVFGIADDYGSLEPNKVANLVIWSGDPFEFASAVERMFIRGREVSLRTRETELMERYRDR
ncbi:MAG TPA: amidohydrolase family protein [Gemmatimonadales bacterium]|nr:amidohydrolase family protein [Gemmatimonadales bacterium]